MPHNYVTSQYYSKAYNHNASWIWVLLFMSIISSVYSNNIQTVYSNEGLPTMPFLILVYCFFLPCFICSNVPILCLPHRFSKCLSSLHFILFFWRLILETQIVQTSCICSSKPKDAVIRLGNILLQKIYIHKYILPNFFYIWIKDNKGYSDPICKACPHRNWHV